MSKVNKTLAILAVLAFFLPFVTISCNKQPLVQVTGAKLVQCSISTCSPQDLFSSKLKSMVNIPGINIPDKDIPTPASKTTQMDDLKLVLFGAIAGVIAIIALFVGARGGELLSGVASVGVIVCLFMFHSKFTDALGPQLKSPEMKTVAITMQIEMQFDSGFWLCVILSACSAILAFKGTSVALSAAGAGGGAAGGFASRPPAGASPGSGTTSFCASCGAGNSAGNKFCLSCGAPLREASAPIETVTASPPKPSGAEAAKPSISSGGQRTVCPSCGSDNSAEHKFCLSCGASLMPNVQLFRPNETGSAASAAAVAPVSTTADQPGGDTDRVNTAAPLAAAAAASPAGQPLPVTAPSKETQTQTVAPSSVSTEMVERQPSLNLQAPQSDPPQTQQTCNVCGAGVTAGQKFCLSCGTRVGEVTTAAGTSANIDSPAVSASPQTQQPVCSACAAAVSEGQKFCLACGTPVGQSAATSKPSAAPPASATQQQQPVQTQLFQPAPRSSAKHVVLVTLLLAVLGGGGWYAWKYFTRPEVVITTFPQKTHVAIGGKTSLQASVSGSGNTDVDWTIQEGNKGGSINDLGAVMSSGQVRAGAIYNAPQNGGVFHVIATSRANPSRSAKIEIVVGGSLQPDSGTSAGQLPSTPAPAPSSPASPMAAQIVGKWFGPPPGMQTVIGADSTISMTSETDASKNLNGTYRFTDNSHLEIDFGNGDVRKWEIVGVDNKYLRVTSQSKDGTSAIIFARVQ